MREQAANSPSTSIDNNPFPSPEERSSWICQIRQRLILYEDENYLAIHKPADLQMDGPHGAAIHKLLLYHSFLNDNPHKMAHQFDYATSEVLLVGKSKRATSAAC